MSLIYVLLAVNVAILFAATIGLMMDMRDQLYRNYIIAIFIATIDMMKHIYMICEFIIITDKWIAANIVYYLLIATGNSAYIIYDIAANVGTYSEYYLRFTIFQFILCFMIYMGIAIYIAINLI